MQIPSQSSVFFSSAIAEWIDSVSKMDQGQIYVVWNSDQMLNPAPIEEEEGFRAPHHDPPKFCNNKKIVPWNSRALHCTSKSKV